MLQTSNESIKTRSLFKSGRASVTHATRLRASSAAASNAREDTVQRRVRSARSGPPHREVLSDAPGSLDIPAVHGGDLTSYDSDDHDANGELPPNAIAPVVPDQLDVGPRGNFNATSKMLAHMVPLTAADLGQQSSRGSRLRDSVVTALYTARDAARSGGSPLVAESSTPTPRQPAVIAAVPHVSPPASLPALQSSSLASPSRLVRSGSVAAVTPVPDTNRSDAHPFAVPGAPHAALGSPQQMPRLQSALLLPRLQSTLLQRVNSTLLPRSQSALDVMVDMLRSAVRSQAVHEPIDEDEDGEMLGDASVVLDDDGGVSRQDVAVPIDHGERRQVASAASRAPGQGSLTVKPLEGGPEPPLAKPVDISTGNARVERVADVAGLNDTLAETLPTEAALTETAALQREHPVVSALKHASRRAKNRTIVDAKLRNALGTDASDRSLPTAFDTSGGTSDLDDPGSVPCTAVCCPSLHRWLAARWDDPLFLIPAQVCDEAAGYMYSRAPLPMCYLHLRSQSQFRLRLAHIISPRTALFYLPSSNELWRCAAAPFRMCRLGADSQGEPDGGSSFVSSRSIGMGDSSSIALRYGFTVDDLVLVLIVASSILQVRCRCAGRLPTAYPKCHVFFAGS